MDKITAAMYFENSNRFILVDGNTPGAPKCAYGNTHQWVGYDKETDTFVRFTKSVYKKLINEINGEK
jgi:hypothetical protein